MVGAALLQPVEWHMRVQMNDEFDERIPLLDNAKTSSNTSKKSDSGWSKLAALMDVAILKRVSFLNLVIGLGLAYTASTSFSLFFPYFLQVITPPYALKILYFILFLFFRKQQIWTCFKQQIVCQFYQQQIY